MNNPTRIIVHHSLTGDSQTVSWGAIRHNHRHTRGWRDIGYHAGIEDARGQFECFYGRPDHERGAHTRGHNRDTLGFCFVGDYNEEAPPADMLKAAVRRVIVPWCLLYGIPASEIRPHSEFSMKTCPGTAFPMDELRDLVRAELEAIE